MADTRMVGREDLKRGMSTLLDSIRAVERQQAALAGAIVPAAGIWNVDACAVR